jgi:hypothetical protein
MARCALNRGSLTLSRKPRAISRGDERVSYFRRNHAVAYEALSPTMRLLCVRRF